MQLTRSRTQANTSKEVAIILTVQGKGSITDGDVFIFPTDEELTGDDINAFITANDDLAKDKYLPAKKMYLGQHQIIDDAKKGSWARQSSCWQLGSLYRGYLQWVLHWYSTEDHARQYTGQHCAARVERYEQRSGQIKRDQQASSHFTDGRLLFCTRTKTARRVLHTARLSIHSLSMTTR